MYVTWHTPTEKHLSFDQITFTCTYTEFFVGDELIRMHDMTVKLMEHGKKWDCMSYLSAMLFLLLVSLQAIVLS